MQKTQETLFIILLLLICIGTSCEQQAGNSMAEPPESDARYIAERAAIIASLSAETQAAFSRDYSAWQACWVQTAYVSKTYFNIPENTYTESLGWAQIDTAVRTFLAANPTPEPAPTIQEDVHISLYGIGAWVAFVQYDALRGFKRETRLMEKVQGRWKIAAMHTTIYGTDREKTESGL